MTTHHQHDSAFLRSKRGNMNTAIKRNSFVLIILMFSNGISANTYCKVDGSWFPYTSPECSTKQAPPPVDKSSPAPISAQASNSWAGARPDALTLCTKRHDDLALVDGCLRNEELGFQEFKTDYDLPSKDAARSKARCAARHDSWALRAGCMRNESKSYQRLYGR